MHLLIIKIIYTALVVPPVLVPLNCSYPSQLTKQKKAVFGITNYAAVKLIENQVRSGDSKNFKR
jgi:hypothetical protein